MSLYKRIECSGYAAARGIIRVAVAAVVVAAGAAAVMAQDKTGTATDGPSHEGAQYGHADSSVAQILVSTHATEHFDFRFAESEAALTGLFSVLEANYARVAGVFNIQSAEKLKVEIYPDIKKYHQRTFGPKSQDWMIGNFDPDENVLRIASPNNPGSYHKYDSVLRAAVHEFAHSVVHRFLGGNSNGVPVWLGEGTAIYYEGPPEASAIKEIKNAIGAGKVPTIANLNENFLKYGGYAFSGTIVEYIIEKHGPEKFRAFLKDPSSYERAFSMSEKKFSDKWRKYLIAKYR